MAEPGDAAAFIGGAPFEVLRAVLGSLSSTSILRMRLVCKAWRDKLRIRALLVRLNRAEPPKPLLCYDRAESVESVDLRSGELRAVLRFTDIGDPIVDNYDLLGNDAPPINDNDDAAAAVDEIPIDYDGMANYGEPNFRPQVTVHGSLDGYLLVSFSTLPRWYIVNPATRQWVQFPNATNLGLTVVGFYRHGPSGSYRALCVRPSNAVLHEAAPTYRYEIIHVRPGQRRSIGLPVSAEGNDRGLRFGVERSSVSPPIQWRRNMDLLWTPQQSQGLNMLVFHTESERFSWKGPPPPVNFWFNQEMRLLEFPDGNLGLSVSRVNNATLELWCLQDYQNEVWVRRHRIQLALQQMPALQLHEHQHPWTPAFVSGEGDVLIECRYGVFQCDRGGNLLHRFGFNQPQSVHRRLPIRHVLRRSFVHHSMFERLPHAVEVEPPFFRWMCSDE